MAVEITISLPRRKPYRSVIQFRIRLIGKLSGLLILIAAILTGCGGGDRSAGRTIQDGVEIVENGAGIYAVKGEPRALALREEFRIDTEEDAVAATGLTDIENLDVDARGRIVIYRRAATSGNTVFVFDGSGRFERSFCPIGQGPGEVQNPRFMRLNAKDQIPVVSMGSQKVLFFDGAGTVIRTTALPELLFPFPHGFCPLANGDYVIAYMRVKPETLEFSSCGIGLFGPDFSKRLELKVYPVPNEDELKTLFIDFPVAAVSRTAIFLTSLAPTREIEVYDFSGRLIRKILADYPMVDVPPGFREEILHLLPPEHPFRRNLVFPKTFPPFLSLFTDDRDRLYAVGYGQDPATGAGVCDVFSPGGVRVLRTAIGYQRLQLGPPLRDVIIKNGRLYCVREKPSGFPEVLVYSLQWTAD
jgi:hypothetical protein